MWRMCNYTQLKPFINGCKRYQLPVEVNSNVRIKSSSCSRPSQTIMPNKSLTKKETMQQEQGVKFKCTSHSNDNPSNCYLRNINSRREPSVRKESHLYTRKTLLNEKNTESDFNKNFPDNFNKKDFIAEKKIKIDLNRCEKCALKQKESPHEIDRFYDCEETSSDISNSCSGLASRAIDKKTNDLATPMSPTKIKCKPSNRTLSGKSEQCKSYCSDKDKNGRENIQHGCKLRSTDDTVKLNSQSKDPIPKYSRCINCDSKSRQLPTYMLSGTLRCIKFNANGPKHQIKSNDKFSKNAMQANNQLEHKNSRKATVKRNSQSQIPPVDLHPVPGKGSKHLISKISQPLPLLEDALRKLQNDPFFTLSTERSELLKEQVKQYDNKRNVPFLFDAMRVYDGIPTSNKISTSARWPIHPKSWNKNHIMQSFREDQSSFDLAKKELRKELIESNADTLFLRVKKKSSELWTNQLQKSGNNEADQSGLPSCQEKQTNSNSDSRSTNAKAFTKNTNTALPKPELKELCCHKSNNIERMQDHPKIVSSTLSDNNSQIQQQKLSKEFDRLRFDEQHSIKAYVDYIKSEMSQIDNVINQCKLLKRKYGIHLEDNCAEYLQQMFIKNNNVLQEVGSMLQKKCLDAIRKEKNITENKLKKPKLPCKFRKFTMKSKLQQLEEVIQTAKANHKKLKLKLGAIDKNQKNAEKSPAANLPKQCGKSQKEKTPINAKGKCVVSDLQKVQECRNIKRETEVAERNKAEMRKLNEQPKQCLAKQDSMKVDKLKDKNTTNTVRDRLKKDILPPYYMLNDDINSIIFQRNKQDYLRPHALRRLESKRQLFGLQNQRGITKSVGILDALGIPHATRLDSINYLFEFRNRFDFCCPQQQLSKSLQDVSLEPEEFKQHSEKSLINRWVNIFGDLPLQMRPGSKILLPLPHSRGSYFISDSDTCLLIKCLDHGMGKGHEYDDSDS